MSDELVERVAILICNAMFPGKVTDYPDFDPVEMLARLNAASRAALSALSALPSHELLREALEALTAANDALRENIAWEADLIMSEREWADGIPCPTPAMWNKLTNDLQHKRNVATNLTSAAAQKLRQALTQDQP